MLGVLAQGLELASTSCVQLLKDMHDGEIDLVVIQEVTQLWVQEQFVDAVVELIFYLGKGRVLW